MTTRVPGRTSGTSGDNRRLAKAQGAYHLSGADSVHRSIADAVNLEEHGDRMKGKLVKIVAAVGSQAAKIVAKSVTMKIG